jgi:hypothetical protein
MKTYILLLSLSLFISCNNDDCEDEGTSNTVNECVAGEKQFFDVLGVVNINNFDNQAGSIYQNQVFSTLEIKQNRFETCVNGSFQLNGYTENIITFKNITNHTVSFDYLITQNLNGNIRQYQGVISNLPPNQSNINNTGDNTFYNVNNSQITVQMNTITYN